MRVGWLALLLLGCPEAVEIPECLSGQDCPSGVCRLERCVRSDGALPDGALPDGARPDASVTVDPRLLGPIGCAAGCECGPIERVTTDASQVSVGYAGEFWVAVGGPQVGLWRPGCADVETLEDGGSPALLGDGDRLGVAWENDGLRFSVRTPSDCSTEGTLHDLLDASDPSLALNDGVFHIAAQASGQLHLAWHDGTTGGSTNGSIPAGPPTLARAQLPAAGLPLRAVWVLDGALQTVGFRPDRTAETVSTDRSQSTWRAASLQPLSDREFLVLGVADQSLRTVRLTTAGTFGSAEDLLRVGASSLNTARLGDTFGVVVSDGARVSYVQVGTHAFPLAEGTSGAIAAGEDRFGVAWVEEGGVAFQTVRCQ